MIEMQWRGTAIRLSLLFPALVVVLLVMDKSGMSIWCLAASAMHEAGHFAALLAFSARPSRVEVGIFGIRVEQEPHTPLSYGKNILVSLSGPLVNLGSCILLVATSGLTIPAAVHASLAFFNLLPIEPLDGGQALLSLLAMRLEEERAERLVFLISVFTILPLFAAGFYMLAVSGYNISLLVVCIYLSLLILFKRG